MAYHPTLAVILLFSAVAYYAIPKSHIFTLLIPPQTHNHAKLPFSKRAKGGTIDCGHYFHTGYPWKLRLPEEYTMLKSLLALLGSVLNVGKFFFCAEVAEFRINSAERSDLLNSKRAALSFLEDGFTLIDLKNTTYDYLDWHAGVDKNSDFTDRMENEIKRLFSNASLSFDWTASQVRGIKDQQYLNFQSHNDIFYNMTQQKQHNPEHHLVKTTGKFKVLGIWKPIHMTSPVCDNPLVLLSAKGYQRERDEVPVFLDFYDFKKDSTMHYKHVAGVQHNHANRHRWYSYPSMTSQEVIVFTHYTHPEWGKPISNPHFSFHNKSCEGEEPRRSVDFTVTVFQGE